jgi:outer membrane receptor protein involved in Fe transport
VTVTNQYIGKQMLDYENFQTTYVLADGSLPPKSLFTLGARVYTDVQVRFDVKKNWEFYLGAKNAFDVKMPPLYGSVGNFNPTSLYDPIGRRFYAGFRIKM